jgi:hypothetical protein
MRGEIMNTIVPIDMAHAAPWSFHNRRRKETGSIQAENALSRDKQAPRRMLM